MQHVDVSVAGSESTSDPSGPPRRLFAPRDGTTPPPDVAGDLPRYRAWVAAREQARLDGPPPPEGPEVAVLVVVDDPDPAGLARCLAALATQTSPRWRLVVTVVGRLDPAAERVLSDGLAALAPGRVQRDWVPAGTRLAAAHGGAIGQVGTAAVVVVVDQHDVLAPDALSQLSAALRDADVAYADEDRLDGDGLPVDPRLKPDWSPELLTSCCYVGRPLALRVDSVVAAGGFDPAADPPLADDDVLYDLVLRVTERTQRVAHVAEVLSHSPVGTDRVGSGTAAPVVAALARRHQAADVAPGPLPGTWRVVRQVDPTIPVSIIVPFRDSARLLRACADSVATTTGANVELLLVDNGSVTLETLTLIERLSERPGVTIRHDPRPFNWAALNNAAAQVATGDVLVFMNDDVVALHAGWLEALVAQAIRPEVGAVGARLLYPSGRVQHAGVVIGMGGAASHPMIGLPGTRPGYLGMAVLTRDVTAVTGACMAVRREVYERLDRFDESYAVDMNDVDLCLRARQLGLRIVYEPLAELVHHESPSRGSSGSPRDIISFLDRWATELLAGDPFFNRHLTRRDVSAGLGDAGELEWWKQWRESLHTMVF